MLEKTTNKSESGSLPHKSKNQTISSRNESDSSEENEREDRDSLNSTMEFDETFVCKLLHGQDIHSKIIA